MSRLIDELRASDYPDSSPRDLTLRIGQWLEQQKRDDVFLANPDFATEYHTLKDEIDRARRPGYGEEFKGAFGAAVDDMQASGYALGALAAHGAKAIGIPGAEPVRNNLLRLMKEQQDEAAAYRPSVGSFEQISGEHPLEDTARYATYALGTVGPSMVQAVVSGLAGAGIGGLAGTAVEPGGGTAVGAVGGGLLGLAEKRLAQKAVSKLLEQGVKTVTLEAAAQALPREAVIAEAKRLAIQYGGQAALAASSVGQEVGSIYGDNPDAPGAAIAYGIPAGLLDVLPEAYIASRFLGAGKRVAEAEAKRAVGYFRRFAEEAAKVVPMEGTTEAAQTLLEIAAAKSGRGESPTSFTDADYRQMLNAGIIGAIGGLAMAPGSAIANPSAKTDPTGRIADAVVDRLPLGDAEPRGFAEFGGEIPEQDLIGRQTLGPGTQQAIAAEERVGFEGFNPGEEQPFMIGADQSTPPVKLPTSVQNAVANAEEAARAWEIAHASTPEIGFGNEPVPAREFGDFGELPVQPAEREQLGAPPSAQITDAPLTNLVGTVVEYQGYRGTLVRDREGNFMVLPPTRPTEKPFWIEVANTGKDGTLLGSVVGVVPTEPANMAPKPAPGVAVPQGGAAAPRGESLVPLGDLFPSDLGPRQDIALPNRTQSGEVAAAAAPNPSVAVAPAQAPTQGATPAPSAAVQSQSVVPNTRGQGVQYHGASKPFDLEESGHLNYRRNILGNGLYTTDAYDIGQSYRNKNVNTTNDPAPTVYSIAEKQPVKFYDVNQRIAKESNLYRVLDSLRDGGTGELWATAIDEAEKSGELTLDRIMAEARGWSRELNVTSGEVIEDFHVIQDALEKEGYGGFQDIGGKRAGRGKVEPHTVKVYWHPNEQVQMIKAAAPVVAESAPTAEAIPLPVIQPTGVVTQPTAEQVIASGDNGVKPLPADSAPNLRRLQVFEQPTGIVPEAGQTVESQAIGPNPMVELVKRVKKATKAESNVVAVIVDRATGQTFQRLAYGGPSNTVYLDLGSKRKGTATGQGSTVSYEADFVNGTEGRPISGARGVFAERLPDGTPRYQLYGIGELTKPGTLANWNLGPVVGLAQHPGLMEAARRGWTETAQAVNSARAPLPAVPTFPRMAEQAGRAAITRLTDSLAQFQDQITDWLVAHQDAASRQAATQRIDEFGEALAKAFENPKVGRDFAESMKDAIRQRTEVQLKQAVALSADYTVAPASTIDLFHSTLQALTEGRDVDVAAFQQELMGAVDAAAQTTGMVLSPTGRQKIVAFGVSSITGPVKADTILSLLHEAAHVVTDGLAEPLRVAFQESVDRLGWRSAPDGRGRWLMNPRSLDIRLLANADPAQLSIEQRDALERLTAEEIAAARRIDPQTLVEEQMAEHLAQLGWDKSEAKGAVQALIRFIKEMWLRLSMAVQRTLKGADQTSPALARQYVENRFLQFINRDSALARDRINDLLNWLGVRPTERQMIPVFPASNQWDQRMAYVDVATGEMIPVDHATYTPDAQTVYLKTALDQAARWVKDHPPGTTPDTPEFRQTRRAQFTAPLSFTPTIQWNTQLAALNLEEEIYRQLAADPDIGPLVSPSDNFLTDWLRLPDGQRPTARRDAAEQQAKATPDPLSGQPIAYDLKATVDGLPAFDEPLTDREGKPVTIRLTEAQDRALQLTIASLNDTEARVQRRITTEEGQLADLERQRKRNPADFPEASLRELDALKESLPLRRKIVDRLEAQRKALLAKFNPSDLVNVYPTAKYPTVPSADATEAQILAAPKGVLPRDYKFTEKATLANHLAAMDAWLRNPDNRAKGQIYGTVAEWYRKLNQIPVDLEIAGTASVFRRAITGGFADEFRKGGLRALQFLGRKIFEVADVVNTHNERMAKSGAQWSTAFGDFARAMGEQPDQSFKERVWDPLMRVWNFIDVSERNQIGTPQEGDLFGRIEAAMKATAGVELGEKQRTALRGLLMQTIEAERQIRTVYEQYPALKVYDESLGTYRRLVSHGLVTGRRTTARHITGLYMRMNPEWSLTAPLGPDDVRTFWDAAGELYRDDRAAFDAQIGKLFEGYTITDFVEPLMNNNTPLFEVTDADGLTRKASLPHVREAWATADGSVVKFAENLHALEGGKPGDEGRTVGQTLAALRRMFEQIKSDQDARNGTEAFGHEILPRQMMDARIANDWPAEWVSYSTYGTSDNLGLLHQLARAVGFGPDAIAGSGELAQTLSEAKKDLAELYARFDDLYRQGKSLKEIERLMGSDEFRVARNADKITANLNKVEAAFRQMSSQTNYLSGDFRLLNDMLGLMASSMVGNPRGAAINFIGDLLGPLVSLKLSRPALRAAGAQIRATVADIGNSVLQAFGQNAAWNVDAARRRQAAGVSDPDLYISWREKRNNLGPGLALSAPVGYESTGARVRRGLGRFAAQARDIVPNLGSPLQGTSPEQTLSPKLRWSVFGTSAHMTMNANIDAAYQVFTDLATRGVDYINRLPTADRAQFVRELELGVHDLTADQLGYFGGLILNDRAAFDSMRNALETKMAGEKSVGAFVAKAYRRFEGAAGAEWDAIGNSQFTGIINYANTEWTLQSNFASLPPWMQSGPLRPLFIFLTWPYNAMRKFGKTFLDPEGRVGRNENGGIVWWGENSTIMDGLKTFFLLSAPATIAGSFAIDWYDKYVVGKKQNLREASLLTAVPVVGAVVDPAAFLERIGRYGSAGFATEIVNQIVNLGTERNLSLDNRIVAINAIGSMINSLAITPYQQRGNITYASVGRPFLQSIGGAGVLQYLQIMQNMLGLNTQDAAINARINTGNYLRAAGRELNLPVAVFSGAASVPTPISPYLQQMELAALVNNPELFREAYRSAIQAARDEKKENPEKYVADNFAERHPLKRLFKGTVSESDYRRMQGEMGEYGAAQVRAAINSFNRYLNSWFGKKSYFGKADKDSATVEQLISRATRINSDLDHEDSLLGIR